MPYRLLHLADLHLDRAFASLGCRGEAARRRRRGLRDALLRVGEAARAHGCHMVSIGGDLYEHERVDLDTGRFLASTFASWGDLRVVIAPGNHDPLCEGSLYARTRWPANVHIFSEQRLTPLRVEDGLTMWGMAHLGPSFAGDPLAIEPVGGDGGVHLALFHGAELGSRPEGKEGHGPFRAEDIAARGFALALCGHYHRRRIDRSTGLVYPGSPEPLAFDEEGSRGPVLVEVDGRGGVEASPLALNQWCAVTADCDVAGAGSSTDIEDRASGAARAAAGRHQPSRLMLRLRLVGPLGPELGVDAADVEDAVRERTGIAVARVEDATRGAVEALTVRDARTVRGSFSRELLAELEQTDDPLRRALLEDALRYGLEALAGSRVALR